MTKSELIKRLTLAEGISQKAAETVVNVAFESMGKTLLEGGRIEIRGLGSFKVKDYEGYTGRNPVSGEEVEVSPKRLPFFKMGKELKRRLNGKER
jgi:integration host factor subunit beta